MILDARLDAGYDRDMSKVTGKFQITLPRRLADAYGIKVGDEVELIPAGDAISIVPARSARPALSVQEMVHHFDQATQRQRGREQSRTFSPAKSRGWKREELYRRGRAR